MAEESETDLNYRGEEVPTAAPRRIKRDLVNVTFIQPWQGHSPGERAGFRPHVADRLIALKLAYVSNAGHAPLNAAILDSTPKGATREELREGAAPADDGEESYFSIRSRAQKLAHEKDLAITDFKRDSLIAFLAEHGAE